jgi:hypothetical protein
MLHHQPRQLERRGNELRNSPLLGAETVIGLEDSSLEGHLASSNDILDTSDRWIPISGSCTWNIRKTHEHTCIVETGVSSGDGNPTHVINICKATFDPVIGDIGFGNHIRYIGGGCTI